MPIAQPLLKYGRLKISPSQNICDDRFVTTKLNEQINTGTCHNPSVVHIQLKVITCK